MSRYIPLYRNPDLFVPSEEQPAEGGKLAQESEIEHEHREVAHRKRPRSHLVRRDNEDDPGADVHRVTKDRVEYLVKHPVPYGHLFSRLVDLTKVTEYQLFGGSDLDRLDGSEHLGDKTGHYP